MVYTYFVKYTFTLKILLLSKTLKLFIKERFLILKHLSLSSADSQKKKALHVFFKSMCIISDTLFSSVFYSNIYRFLFYYLLY